MYLQKQKITKNFIIDIFIHMLIGDSHMVDLYYTLLKINKKKDFDIVYFCTSKYIVRYDK